MQSVAVKPKDQSIGDWMTSFTRFCENQGLDVDETISRLKDPDASLDDKEYVSVAGLIDQTDAYA